jgi:hypothetical protein
MNIQSKLFPAGKMFVYFGSQTGTAESFSRIVEKEGISKGSEQIFPYILRFYMFSRSTVYVMTAAKARKY